MTLEQVCLFFGASQQTVYRWIQRGILTRIEMPGRLGNRPLVRFNRADCEALLRKWTTAKRGEDL
jgi:excisionase family DNA binding protein